MKFEIRISKLETMTKFEIQNPRLKGNPKRTAKFSFHNGEDLTGSADKKLIAETQRSAEKNYLTETTFYEYESLNSLVRFECLGFDGHSASLCRQATDIANHLGKFQIGR